MTSLGPSSEGQSSQLLTHVSSCIGGDTYDGAKATAVPLDGASRHSNRFRRCPYGPRQP